MAHVADAQHLGGLPRYALGIVSPLARSDTIPYGVYRLLGSDFIVMSASLALHSFAPEDMARAVAAIAGGPFPPATGASRKPNGRQRKRSFIAQ